MLSYVISMIIERENMKKGFTLTEVLITLGVIGAISVLTLPNLFSGYQNKQLTTQMQRTYNLLRNAMSKYITQEEVDSLESSSLYGAVGDEGKNFLNKNYFNIVKDCGLLLTEPYAEDTGYDCIAKNYTLSDKTATDPGNEFFYCIMVESGASICMTPIPAADVIFIDINGKAKPNVFGKDAFILQIDEEGRIFDKDSDECTTSKGKYGCFGKVQANSWIIE